MYLRYNVKPDFTTERFQIDHPVGSIAESDAYVKHLMTMQNKGKIYSNFSLLDMSKKNEIKTYPVHALPKQMRVVTDASSQRMRR